MAIERKDKPRQEPTPPTLQNDLISQIDRLSLPIKAFWAKREAELGKERIRLLPEEETQFGNLVEPRNQKIIDLLLARNANGWSNILVVLNKGIQGVRGFEEQTHPFSDNSVTIYTPSNYAPTSRTPESDFQIKVKLSGLRRQGISNDSCGAESLLGEKTEAPDLPEDFMYRTRRELMQIEYLRQYAVHQTSDTMASQVVKHLNQLSTNIIIDRFVELKRRGQVPSGFNIAFYLQNPRNRKKPYLEITRLDSPNGRHLRIIVPGQRIGAALNSFGFDYDN